MKTLPSTHLAPSIALRLLGILFCLAAGCMSPARMLDEAAVHQQLRKGQTQAEVRKTFGEPVRTEAASSGKSLDVFLVILPTSGINTVAQRADVRSLHVLYDRQNRVEDFTYYVREMTELGAIPGKLWHSGRRFDAEKIGQIKRNVTTRDQLLEIFGPAMIEGITVYGDKTMAWFFGEGRNATLLEGRSLAVRLDRELVVTDYAITTFNP